jgi:hypothetical protein
VKSDANHKVSNGKACASGFSQQEEEEEEEEEEEAEEKKQWDLEKVFKSITRNKPTSVGKPLQVVVCNT